MATKFHINPETGKPGRCTATKKGCKYAVDGVEPQHYSSEKEAQKAASKQLEAEHGALATTKKDEVYTKPINLSHGEKAKTFNEYKENLEKIHRQYGGKTYPMKETFKEIGFDPEQTQEALFGKGSENIMSYYGGYTRVAKYPLSDKLRLQFTAYVASDGRPGYEDVYNNAPITNSPYFEELDNWDEGYGDDSVAYYYYKIPSQYREEFNGIYEAEQTKREYSYLKDKNLPDWAALPTEATMDNSRNKFTNASVTPGKFNNSSSFFQGVRPEYPRKEAKRLKQLSDPEAGIKETNQKIKEKEKELSSPEGLNKGVAKNIEGEIKNLKKRKEILKNLHPEAVRKAKDHYEKLNKDYHNELVKTASYQLSKHYPSSDEKVRMEKATEWVKTHPELLGNDGDRFIYSSWGKKS